MFKKIISTVIATISLLSLTSITHAAKVGSVIGEVLNTDIVAYINNYAIPSFAAKGTSVVVAEDLRNFGFDVVWNASAKTLNISRNGNTYPNEMNFKKTGGPSTKFADLLYTDIKVYANGIKIPSYAINGYTMIPLESLTMFGSYNWVSEQRALKLWVDGLHIRNTMQPIEQFTSSYYGIWSCTKYPDNYNIYVYEQNGNTISLNIEAIKGQGSRIAVANVTNVKLTNGTGRFFFEDSFGWQGYGTIKFSNGTMTVSYQITGDGVAWSITAGENSTYVKTSDSLPGYFNPEW